MPQYYDSILALFVLTRLDRTDDKLNHEIHVSTKANVNRSILMKLWFGEVRCYDGMNLSKTSPRHNFINIELFFAYYAFKCR